MIKRILKESIKTITTPLQMLRCHIAAKRYLKHHSIHCLNLGCGENINREWFNTDITFAIYGKHYYMNATKRYPFPDKSIDYIFSEHMFEHLKLTEAVKMLKECRRVLKKMEYYGLLFHVLNFYKTSTNIRKNIPIIFTKRPIVLFPK